MQNLSLGIRGSIKLLEPSLHPGHGASRPAYTQDIEAGRSITDLVCALYPERESGAIVCCRWCAVTELYGNGDDDGAHPTADLAR